MKRYHFHRRSVLMLIAFLLFPQLQSFSSNNQISGLKIIKSDVYELILEYSPVLLGFDKIVTNDGIETYLPIIRDAVLANGNPGGPSKLIIPFNVTIPSKDDFVISEISVTNTQSISKIIAPFEEIIYNSNGFDKIYKINPAKYKNYEYEWINSRYMGIARFRHIAAFEITAAKFDPANSSIIIPEKVIVKIKFDGKNNGLSEVSLPSQNDFNISINHNQTSSFKMLPELPKLKNFGDAIQSLSTGNWIKISIPSEGIYRIDAAMLSGLGYNLSAADVNSLKIFGNGGKHLSEAISEALNNKMNEQSIIVKTKANGELDHILFYGSPAFGFEYNKGTFGHYINNYSSLNYYLLTWGGEPGKRVVAKESPIGAVQNNPSTYYHRIFVEEEINHGFPYPGSGRVWYGRSVFPYDVVTQLNNLDPSSNIQYRFSMAHRNDKYGYFSIKESGTKLANISLTAVSPPYGGSSRNWASGSIQASKISDNRSLLRFEYQSEGGAATGFLDWYEIHYPRSFVAIDNELTFFSDPTISGITEFTINQFSGSEILGFETTNISSPVLMKNESVTGGIFAFKADLEKNKPRSYYISSKIKTPQIQKTEFANLRENFGNTEMILIAHPDLIESANKYKEYREKQSGITVSVVRTDYIYNEFGSGIPDPTAIRDFIAYAFHNWNVKPFYVLLWGRGHYDYKNIQYDTQNYIPTYQSADETSSLDGIQSFTTDDYFVRVAGEDRIIDLTIGRIPVDSPKSGFDFLDKLIHYENNSSNDIWRTFVTLIADDSPTSNSFDGTLHTGQSEKLSSNYIPDYMQQRKLYMPEYTTENVPGGKKKPRLTQDMLSTINTRGTLLLNWIGHGNPRVWAHEEILDRDITIPQFINKDKLYFLTAATCDFARYDIPDRRSGAEEMIMSSKGGAIGAFAATRIVLSYSNAAINENFYKNLFSYDTSSGKYFTLGETMFKVKSNFYDNNDQKFNLLGDPALKILVPPRFVAVESINGQTTNNDTIALKALSEVSIEGSILIPGTKYIDESFEGILVLTMLDGDENTVAIDIDGTKHSINKHGGALNQSSYKVNKGKFTANFIIPKDISFSKNNGRLFLYAYSLDGRYAKGNDRSFKVDGINENPNPDNNPPEIKIYLDARTFQDCDIVSPEPLLIVDLLDDSGINTTGKGVGHRIEAWIDDNYQSIDLTDNFVTSLDNPRAGTAERILFGLNPGKHKVRVRAWDVYNNFSVAEACFHIGNKNDIVLRDLYSRPNPAEIFTAIGFYHNLKPPFDLTVQIYNLTGQLVRTLSKRSETYLNSEIDWNILDENGRSVPTGIYIFKISVYSENIGMNVAIGKLAIVK